MIAHILTCRWAPVSEGKGKLFLLRSTGGLMSMKGNARLVRLADSLPEVKAPAAAAGCFEDTNCTAATWSFS